MFNKLDNNWYGNYNLNTYIPYILSKSEKNKTPLNPKQVKALIVPHAGYKYSGLCAAYAYSHLLENSEPNKHFESIILF